ncbi:hypothetical protein [Aquimarina sp. MMG016]|uniref:hypothetical protein n=1 Tax=Aquimarina sp. MMG016 TaxID=2822690 RepID=UPI001B3A7AF5|nr:hypothetical protein [Aquimarina sp. MMG016]MBQ4822732.1 hypothetical protein [Aquimarina sp. MMG016]
MVIFGVSLGAGTSLYLLENEVSYSFLKLGIEKEFGLKDTFILGPGSIEPEHKLYPAFTWRFSTSLTIQSAKSLNVSLGFSFSSLGNFVIMERSPSEQSLFTIDSFNAQNGNGTTEKLSLQVTNKKRKIIYNEVFIKVSLW